MSESFGLADFSALIIAALMAPVGIKIFSFLIPRARRLGLIDRPGGRHMHAMPVAVIGGLGVILTWMIGMGVWMLFFPEWAQRHAQEIGVTLGCVLSILTLGLVDDRGGVAPRLRMAIELLIAGVTVAYLPPVHAFCQELSLVMGVAVYPLVAVGIVGVMNSMNLVDGMDGLAGSMLLFISLAVAAISAILGGHAAASGIGGLSALLLVPGLLAFLRKNWNPAATFLGDHGSLSVGYLLVTAALGIRSRGGDLHSPADICLMVALFSYPMLDMVICMARRLRAGLPVSAGDRNHMHHRMLRLGLTTRESVVGIIAWQVAMIVPSFLIRALPATWALAAPLLSIAVALERLVLLGRVESARLRQLQTRVAGLASKPRLVPQISSSFVRARVTVPLQPMIEAAQFEEKGYLEPMIESLQFFCERRVRGHGFVQLTSTELQINLVGSSQGAPTAEELRNEWVAILKEFSAAFRLTYSTWVLPVKVTTARVSEADADQDAAADDRMNAA